jgi:carbon-monoxide dehydrogenase catalytic subunit
MGIKTEGRSTMDIAKDVAETALAQFGQQTGDSSPESGPASPEDLARAKIAPGIDREVVEVMHRTHMGTDQDAENILDQALRTA